MLFALLLAATLHDLPYGPHPVQKLDVYVPPGGGKGRPVIFMVHGGGWRIGDKENRAVVENKAKYWLPRGYIFISADNRLLPDATPLEQAKDIARAVAFAQQHAAQWGGDPDKFVLMGHSAGAHLVALITASPTLARDAHMRPWRGTVLLDSAALDVPRIMQAPHFRLYDDAFGSNPAGWRAASPFDQLQKPNAPVLAVCSSRRLTSCTQADAFAAKVNARGGRASVLRENKSHRQINEELGSDAAYTAAVQRFIER